MARLERANPAHLPGDIECQLGIGLRKMIAGHGDSQPLWCFADVQAVYRVPLRPRYSGPINTALMTPPILRREPRWPAAVALAAVACLSIALAPGLSIGPPWLFPAIVGLLLAPAVMFHRAGYHTMDRWFGMATTAVVTLELVAALIRLVNALPSRRESPKALLLSASSIWLANLLVFALWYWRLDAGGPHDRDTRASHTSGAFLFPQMTMTSEAKSATGQNRWSPTFLDYLFLAFNTSTAFSPTDTPALARWGKALMMLQSLISLTVLALLAARAVNIL